MHFFLLFFIPAATICLISTDSKYGIKQFSAPLFTGFIAGTITSLFIEFFINSERIPGSTILSIMLSSSACTLIPSTILTSLFIFFSKDEIEYKIKSTVPLLGMFYAVFIPYLTLTSGEKDSFFMTFLNPILFMETIMLLQCALKCGITSYMGGDRKKALISLLSAVLAAILQPVMLSLWYLKFLAPLAYITPVLMLLISLFVYKFFSKE